MLVFRRAGRRVGFSAQASWRRQVNGAGLGAAGAKENIQVAPRPFVL